MHPEYEKPMGSGTPEVEYYVFDGVTIPDEIYEQAMISENKAYTEDPVLRDFMVNSQMRLMLKHHSKYNAETLELTSVHVHIGDKGLTAHSHDYEFPNVLSVVVYLMDSSGYLVVDPDGRNHEIPPRRGRVVLMSSNIVHSVKPSEYQEMRIALVANYEC